MVKSLNQAVRDYLEQLAGSTQRSDQWAQFEARCRRPSARLNGWRFDRDEPMSIDFCANSQPCRYQRLFTSTWTSPALARFFNERGWMVAFPQRRGRGKSGGLYDEGFAPDRSGYSCEPKLSLPGLERALTDIDVAAAYLAGRPDVDGKQMLLGGQSRGGIAAIAYAGIHPDRFTGVINFVGGWVGDPCWYADVINGESFRRGATYPRPTLWLYGENDPFYRVSHSRKNFEAFKAAGGTGTFHVFEMDAGQSGHGLLSNPARWNETVQSYLETVTGRNKPLRVLGDKLVSR